MYSNKLQEFLEANRPQTEVLTLEDLEVIPGVWITSSQSATTVHLGSGKLSFKGKFLNTTLQWYPKIEGDNVTFIPHLPEFRGGEISPQILGREIRTVALPEPTVTLPIPIWAEAATWDSRGGWVESLVLFQSEAIEELKKFMETLQDLLHQLS